MTTTNALTEAEFTACQDKIDAEIRATQRGTPERAAAVVRSDEWEAAYNLPVRTLDQRTARHAAIVAVARALNLI